MQYDFDLRFPVQSPIWGHISIYSWVCISSYQSAANSETRTKPSERERERGDAVTSKIDVISVRVSERKRERLITVTDQTAAHLHRGRCFVYTDFGLIMDSTSVPKHCLLRFPLISPHLLKSSWQETCRREGTHAPHLLPLSALSSSWS